MILMENALSNEVYFDEENKYIIKKYSQDKFKKIFGNQEVKILKKLNYEFIKKKKNILNIKFINHKPFNDKEINIQDLSSVAKTLKTFHQVNTKGIKPANFKKVYKKLLLKGTGSKKGWIDKTEKKIFVKAMNILSSGEQVLLHNDLVEGNLLKVGEKIELIDFEYSGLGNRIFDIASFLTERELNESEIQFFIDSYDVNINKEDLIIVSSFLQIFWSRWALYKYSKTNNNVYKKIAKWKYNEYKKLIIKNDSN